MTNQDETSAATHDIKALPFGGFTLEVRPAVVPGEAAERLASDIKAELDRPDEESRLKGAEKIAALRNIAELGLASPAPNPVAAREALFRSFGRSRVRVEDGDIVIEVPRNADKEQIDFLVRFDDAERLIGKLRQPRRTPAYDLLRGIPSLPRRLLDRLVPPAAAGQPDPGEGHRASEPADLRLNEATVEAMQRIARLAFPDRASDRTPDPALAGRLLERLVAREVADFGPGLRGAYLKDLAAAFALTLLSFAGALVLLALFWAALFGSRQTQPLHATFGMVLVAMGFLFLGAWLSAAQRLNNSAADTIESVLSEAFDSWIRAVLLIGTGIVVFALLHMGVVVIQLSESLSSKNVLSSLPAAVVVGAFLGLAERKLPTALTGRGEDLANRLGIQGSSSVPITNTSAGAAPASPGGPQTPQPRRP
jgi:hypothetical protein